MGLCFYWSLNASYLLIIIFYRISSVSACHIDSSDDNAFISDFTCCCLSLTTRICPLCYQDICIISLSKNYYYFYTDSCQNHMPSLDSFNDMPILSKSVCVLLRNVSHRFCTYCFNPVSIE